MKNKPVALAFLLALMSIPSTARADLITTGFGANTVIDFSQFAGIGYNFTFGPDQIGEAVGLDVMFTANPFVGGNSRSGSVLGSGDYGLGSNGDWRGDKTYSGLDSSSGGMTYTFNFGLVSTVGGFVNYATGYGTVIIEALNRSGNILESHMLDVEAPISTPAGLNEGAFRGIQRASADIAAFRVSNAYVVLDDLAFNRSPGPVPEPATLILFGSGAVALATRKVRRKSNS
jgi:hypothetical protein